MREVNKRKPVYADCPIDLWMNVKICLPDNQRGNVLGKIIRDNSKNYHAVLTYDENLLPMNHQTDHQIRQIAIDNLASLPADTILLFLSPEWSLKNRSKRMWITKLGTLKSTVEQLSANQYQVTYVINSIEELEHFPESRVEPRLKFKTSVFVIDPEHHYNREFFSYDISSRGISLIVEPTSAFQEAYDFYVGQDYLMKIELHEGYDMPLLSYRCRNIRKDMISGSKIAGFELLDSKAQDPIVKENLALFCWQLFDD